MKNQGIILVALIILSSCASPTVLPPEPKVNDQWTFRFKTYDESGNVTSTTDKNYTAVGYNRETANFITPWVDLKEDSANFSAYFPNGDYRLENDGLYTIADPTLGGNPVMYLPYPGTIGQTSTRTYNSGFVSSTTIMSITDTATVPYGYFSNLYKYEYLASLGVHANIWFNDSVWFVKYENIDSLTIGTGTYVSQTVELVNYTAN